MANLKSAKKAIRQTKRRTAHNLEKKIKLKKAITEIKKLITAGKEEDAKKKVSALQKILDKSAKTNLIHTNRARRLKSRLTKKLKIKK